MFGRKAVKKPAPKTAKAPDVRAPEAASAEEKPARKNGLTEAELLRAPASQYMSPEQLAFFRERLLETQRELLEKANLTSEHLREHELEADPTDQATIEEEYALSFARAIVKGSSSRRSTRPCAASRKAATAIARRPASPSVSPA